MATPSSVKSPAQRLPIRLAAARRARKVLYTMPVLYSIIVKRSIVGTQFGVHALDSAIIIIILTKYAIKLTVWL